MKYKIFFLLFYILSLNATADDFWSAPKMDYEQRKQLFLQYCADNGSKGGRDGVFNQLARMEKGLDLQENIIRESIAFVYTGRDCNDFSVGGLVRLMYLNKQMKKLSPKLEQEIETCLRDFKYWWDDPRRDSVYRCYHTENHQAICHSGELLAGQLYKDKPFKSGMNGKQHLEHASQLLKRWLDFRARFGFSEWLSNSYYDIDLMTLANLHDFAEDKEIRAKAGLVIDMLMLDMAVNNFRGAFGSTHGRTYAASIMGAKDESTSTVMKLMFGVGIFNSSTSHGAISLATSKYRCPKMIEEIATDYTETTRTKQRQSINVQDAPKYGLDCNNELDCHLFWGMQEFIHPLVVRTSQTISQKYDTWPYRNYDHYIKEYNKQIAECGKVTTSNLDRFALSEANIETYRTSDYMLSSVQDYRKGAQGYQQHIWQATLGVDAVVFTTHPGSKDEGTTPNYWAGNAIMPRAAQFKNVVICIYNTPEGEKYDFTHAYFPQYAFDEVVQKGLWTMARKDDGYIALYSKNTLKWEWSRHGLILDMVAPGRQNIWVCEMGSKSQWGSLAKFVDAVSSADIKADSLHIEYLSPSAGKIEYGWSAPFTVNGTVQSQEKYPRFDNSYCHSDFNSQKIELKRKEKTLVLDLERGKRETK